MTMTNQEKALSLTATNLPPVTHPKAHEAAAFFDALAALLSAQADRVRAGIHDAPTQGHPYSVGDILHALSDTVDQASLAFDGGPDVAFPSLEAAREVAAGYAVRWLTEARR